MQEDHKQKNMVQQENNYFDTIPQHLDSTKYEKKIIQKLEAIEQSIDEAYKNNNEKAILLKLKK